MMSKIIRKVPKLPKFDQLKRVAAYARVSSGKDAMLHSLSSQVSYYNNLIQQHSGWIYAGVYADEALTGTKENRNGFQQLLADCRAGKINMILTKSISRFARNTVTLLETVRELKIIGVDVYFEEQNIHTMSAEGELMLTILASYAQEESLSASENQKWRIQKGFENGELLNWRFMFGYRISKNNVEIDPETAPIVKELFDRVIAGESFSAISRDLNQRDIPCVLDGKWCFRRIRKIIGNEKYTGNAMLQKHYRNNHLEKKKCANKGELPMYYAERTHPAIIDMSTYEKAKAILQRNREVSQDRRHPQKSEFTGKIHYQFCGKNFRRITSRGSAFWNCSTYLPQGKAYCHGKKIPENTLRIVCAEALGLEEYSPSAFTAQIDCIEVPADNHLRFVFKDGSVVEHTWADRSRRESWTPEMRQAAAEKTRQRGKTQCQE
jgi:site-specific DNA recombinase